MNSVVVLASGGTDSALVCALALEAGLRPCPLFIDYGQLAAPREWKACKAVLARVGADGSVRMDLSGYGGLLRSGLTSADLDVFAEAFLPGRNALFLVAATAYAIQVGAPSVAIGLVDEERHLFPDQTSEFVAMAERFLGAALPRQVSIVAPLIGISKREVLRMAAARRIRGVYWCHKGRDRPCGRCVSCRERVAARKGG